MAFDQYEFLKIGIPYRLGNLDLFYHSLRIILSEPRPQQVRMIFHAGHEVRGPYWIFTNPAVETGIMTCRVLLEFLEAEPTNHKDDIFITKFQHPNGDNLSPVPLSAVAGFPPPGVSEGETLEALEFTKKAADKAVAHLTLGPPDQKGKEMRLYQITCLAIRSAVDHHLYKRLGLSAPSRIITHFRRGELTGIDDVSKS
jgi:hypothetical protein